MIIPGMHMIHCQLCCVTYQTYHKGKSWIFRRLSLIHSVQNPCSEGQLLKLWNDAISL